MCHSASIAVTPGRPFYRPEKGAAAVISRREIACFGLCVSVDFALFLWRDSRRVAGLPRNCLIWDKNSMKTFNATSETVKRDWYVVDAAGKTLGRLASEVATRLRGKHKPEYTPHVDTGDYIVIVNAEKVAVTGKKAGDKVYYHHTGFIGGMKSITFEKLIDRKPEMAIELAVKGMMPRNPLGRAMLRKLKVYAGNEHPHTAQQPQPLNI
jgi:large subunit ribosomal protein L13